MFGGPFEPHPSPLVVSDTLPAFASQGHSSQEHRTSRTSVAQTLFELQLLLDLLLPGFRSL